ncbi:MAG: isoprenoid biosynthesis glyoxalase ElbB [Deltaproteobacteria bacterium]|nr:isoprenoid biosynthesis glyoxalase ElbB [Deltaproteobacteria bacterium]
MKKKRVGVLLAGCGVFDGSEIHEAVLTLLYLNQEGVEIVCMAPDIPQAHVINHLTQEEMDETRNVLVESARIARGEIKNLSDVKAEDLDALIIPGGFGAAKNLSDFAFKGPNGTVNQEVKNLLEDMATAGKPIGGLCIAPATIGMALKDRKPSLTVGNHEETVGALKALGVTHNVCAVDQTNIDSDNKIVTTPAYMLGPEIKDVAKGIEKLVKDILSMI